MAVASCYELTMGEWSAREWQVSLTPPFCRFSHQMGRSARGRRLMVAWYVAVAGVLAGVCPMCPAVGSAGGGTTACLYSSRACL